MAPTPPDPTRLDLRLFGGPVVLRDSERLSLSPQQAAFFGVLYGADKERLSREEVLAVFWPDDDPAKARRRLNQLLYSIKKKTAPVVPFLTHDDVLSPAYTVVSTDLARFNAALDGHDLHTCSSLLELGFLSETPPSLGRDLQDWIAGRSGELRVRLRRRAEKLWQEGSRRGDWTSARRAADTLLALAPTDEGHLRKLMEAHGKAGTPEGAELALEEFSRRVRKLTGTSWDPEEETAALLERILGAEEITLASAFVPSQEAFPEPPLLGRDKERDLLRRTLRRPPHEALRTVLVTGEAGIGKTRLLQESLTGIPLEGQQVFIAGSAELEQFIPLNPLIEALGRPGVETVLRELEDPWKTVLYGVMPKHYLGKGPIPEAPQIQPGSVPRRLFEAIHQLLLALVAEEPVILVLEDLQWADQTTLSVVEFLIRRWERGALQIVMSVRSEELRRNQTLRPFLDVVRTHEDFLDIALGDLPPASCEALMQELSPTPLSKRDVAYLRSLAGGNPFFLIELTLEFLAGRVDAGTPESGLITIPLSIRQVLERRQSQLSEDAGRVLEALAARAKPLDVRGLARVARISGSRCLTALDQLVDFRLVSSRGPEVLIRHELIRQSVYQQLPDHRKALLHERVARYLLRKAEPPPADELAVHFHRAGVKPEARKYSLEAAAKAESSGAIAEALRFLRIAREHSDDPHEVAELIAKIGHLNYLHQNLEEAAPLLELAAQRLRRQGDIGAALRTEVELVDALAKTGTISLRDCLEEISRIKQEAREREDWSTITKALDVEVHRLDERGDLDGVRKVIAEARALSSLGGPDAKCQARSLIALNVYFGSPEEALEAARQAVKIAFKTGDRDLQLHALNRLIVVLLYQGLLYTAEGQEAFALAETRLVNCGDLILKFNIRLNRAVWHLEIGELDQAQIAFRGAREVVKGTKARDAQVVLAINEGELALASFNPEVAEASFAKAEELLGPASPSAFKTVISAGLGLCALHSGDLSEARRREAELPVIPTLWTFDPSVIMSFKAKMLKRRGDVAGADQLLQEVGENVRSRLLTAWMKITIERCALLRPTNPEKCLALAREGLDEAERLGLRVREQDFKKLLHSH